MRRKGSIIPDVAIIPLPGEEWELIEETAKSMYFVSNMGRVKSRSKYSFVEKILKPYRKKHHGWCVTLGRTNGNPRSGRPILIAREVANAFIPEFTRTQANRIFFLNGKKMDCRLSNLMQWDKYVKEVIFYQSLSTLTEESKNNRDVKDIVAFMQGDEKAIDNIVIKYEKRLKKWVYRKVVASGKQIEVEDIVQTCLIKFIAGIKRGLLRTTQYLDAWAFTIAKNTLKNEKNRLRIANKYEINLSYDSPFKDQIQYAEIRYART